MSSPLAHLSSTLNLTTDQCVRSPRTRVLAVAGE
jgi:hypothetical protein